MENIMEKDKNLMKESLLNFDKYLSAVTEYELKTPRVNNVKLCGRWTNLERNIRSTALEKRTTSNGKLRIPRVMDAVTGIYLPKGVDMKVYLRSRYFVNDTANMVNEYTILIYKTTGGCAVSVCNPNDKLQSHNEAVFPIQSYIGKTIPITDNTVSCLKHKDWKHEELDTWCGCRIMEKEKNKYHNYGDPGIYRDGVIHRRFTPIKPCITKSILDDIIIETSKDGVLVDIPVYIEGIFSPDMLRVSYYWNDDFYFRNYHGCLLINKDYPKKSQFHKLHSRLVDDGSNMTENTVVDTHDIMMGSNDIIPSVGDFVSENPTLFQPVDNIQEMSFSMEFDVILNSSKSVDTPS